MVHDCGDPLEDSGRSAALQAWKKLPEGVRDQLETIGLPGAITNVIDGLSQRLVEVVRAGRMWDGKEEFANPEWAPSNSTHRIACQGRGRGLSEQYPMLRGILAKQITNWSRFIAGFAAHVGAFVAARRGRGENHRVAVLSFDLSDPHRGGRTVVRVEFEDGRVWYYKPRLPNQEVIWAQILDKLNELGFSPRLISPTRVLSRHNHSWASEVKQRPCRAREEVERFYYRAGALLYLAHLLRAVDLHAGNFIACGEHPVLIDCETLLHPAIRIPDTALDYANPLARTGMWAASHDGRNDSTSFLGRRAHGSHSVVYSGERVFVDQFEKEFVSGFEAAAVIVRHGWKREGFVRLIRRLQATPTRIIYRPTSFYGPLLKNSLSHAIAGSQAARHHYLRMRLKVFRVPRLVLNEELNQIINCDIPVFHGRAATARRPLSPAKVDRLVRLLRQSCSTIPA